MAIAEALAWGYLGFLFGEGAMQWIAAAFTGIVIFLVVWMIDVSLITLDRAWKEHAHDILGQERRRFRLLDVVSFVFRIFLLIASLSITAPYLAQVVFHKDIQRYLDAEATAAIDTTRKVLVEKYNPAIDKVASEIQQHRAQYEQEVAGKGVSHRYGNGPAAQAVLEDLRKLDAEKETLSQEKESALKGFDDLATDWRLNRDKLATSYNVTLPQISVLENRKALDALRQRPEYRSTELAIKGFLGFIFAGLLLLKLFEPNSVRLYMSDVLQQEFNRYLAGTFDSMLPETERSSNSRFVMSPQRFYDFLVRVWVPARQMEARQADAHARIAAATQSQQMLEEMKSRIDTELAQAKAEVQAVCSAADEANKTLTELNSAIVTVSEDLAYFQRELVDLDVPRPSLDEKGELEYAIKRLEYRSHLQKKIADADRALHSLNEEVPIETEKFNRAAAALKRVESRLEAKEAELVETQNKIRAIRDSLRNSAGRRAEAILESVVAES